MSSFAHEYGQSNEHHAVDLAEQLVTDITNKAMDKADTELDSTRVHDGMTLDEFLAGK